jgi:bisphosphoglycerate-dependent phosphoglycerate mutase
MSDWLGKALSLDPIADQVVGDYELNTFTDYSEFLTFEHKQRREKYGEESYRAWQQSHSLGKRRTPEHKKNYSDAAKKRWSDSQDSKKRSEAMRKPRRVFTCPHCNLTGGGGNMKRYHFDNCKEK